MKPDETFDGEAGSRFAAGLELAFSVGTDSGLLRKRARRAIDALLACLDDPLAPPERVVVDFKGLLRRCVRARNCSPARLRELHAMLVSECIDAYFAQRATRERESRARMSKSPGAA